MESYYQTLNLSPQASMDDVKASYRRLVKELHPDSAGPGKGDPARFHRVHEAYRNLLKNIGRAETGGTAGPGVATRERKDPNSAPAPEGQWRFEGVAEDGPDVIYVVRVGLAAARQGIRMILPWQAEDACPRCLGEGHTLAPVYGGGHLMKVSCPRCQGSGVVKHNSTVHVELSANQIGQGPVRMKGLGHYLPTHGRRGDLVVEAKVDRSGRTDVWVS